MKPKIVFFVLLVSCVFLNPEYSLAKGKKVKSTVVSIQGEKFLINGVPTYKGRSWQGHSIEGLLMNSRMVQGIFDDLNPETAGRWKYDDTQKWDANRNTNEFVKAMDLWYAKGELRPDYMKRLKRVIDRANEKGMVVILGLFYNNQEAFLENNEAVLRGVDNTIDWLFAKKYRNVIIEVNNECNLKYSHDILTPERVSEVIKRIQSKKKNGYRYLAGTSFSGGEIPTENVVRAEDFILIHGNGVKDPAKITEMVSKTKAVNGYTPKPIIFNEDDHFDFDKPSNNFIEAVKAYASWGYFDYRMKDEGYDNGFQSVPVNWGISSPRKIAFFNKLEKITGGLK